MTTSSNLKQLHPAPNSPWQISSTLMQRMPSDSTKRYQKWELLPIDPETQFVTHCFLQNKPHKYAIAKIHCIYNPHHEKAFEAELINIEEEAEKFLPRWQEEPHKEWKQKTIARWAAQANIFQPLKTHDTTLQHAKVVLLWHGSSADKCDSVCSSGFTYFGKHHFFNTEIADAQASTDIGYFGSGIYFTNSAHYASLFSQGHLLFSAVSMREPYPLINDCPHPDKGYDMTLLEGKGAYQNYNAHFIPVASTNPKNPEWMDYYPCFQDQEPDWFEYVIFQKAQTFPRFWVELALDTPAPPLKQNYSFSAAYAACQLGELERVRGWIQEDPKRLQDRGLKGETLLHGAAIAGQKRTLDWLDSQDPSLIKTLLADTPFILKLATQYAPRSLTFLFSKGLDSQITNSFKQTLLHLSAQAGQEENIKVLLENKASLDPQDHSKRTPLFLAVIQGHRTIVQLLLAHKARVDLRSIEGETVLHAAVFYGFTLIVQDLLPFKDLILAEDEDGKTPLHKAVWLDPKPDIVSLLHEHGADPNTLNKYNYTPLHWAAKHGHLKSTVLLIQKGANPNLLNNNGDLAIDLAFRHGQDVIAHFLLGTSERLPPADSFSKDVLKHYQDRLLQAHKSHLIEEQIIYLTKISDYYLQTKNFIPAAMILNAALAHLQTHKKNPLFEKYLFSRMERLASFLEMQKINTLPSKNEDIQFYRAKLGKSRAKCRDSLAKQEPIQKILYDLTQNSKKILELLIAQSQNWLGLPPVAWACIAMGSMARNEMCPYSDLEFAFLIEKETPEALNYFRTLARLLQIHVINLGETKCEVFGPLAPSPTPNGYCMDTGGNVPIGGAFELIGTPHTLAQLQTSQWIDTHIILSNAMNSFCCVSGDKQLVKNYLKQKNNILKKKEGKQKNSHKLALRLLSGHLQEFSPNLTQEKEELKAFGIKKELYRPFQEILSSLALFFNLTSFNTIERIEELTSLKVFSKEGAAHLKQAISQALTLRLEAHLFYKDETEFLHQIEQPQDPHKLYLTPQRLEILQEIYKVLIPFCKKTEEFYRIQDKKAYSSQNFYDESPFVLAQALEKTLQYQKARQALQQAVALDPNKVEALLYLGNIEGELGNAQELLKRAEKALKIAKDKYGNLHPRLAEALNNIGYALKNQGHLNEALTYYTQALEIRQSIYGDKHPDVATSLNNIGLTFNDIGKPDKALDYFKLALEIQKTLYKNTHLDMAISLNNIGFALHNLGKLNEALIYYTQAFEIRKVIYGDKHPVVATSLNNMGSIFKDLDNLNEALIYYKQALEIRKAIYGDKHPHVAQSLNNIGLVFKNLGKADEALAYYEQALEVQKTLYGDTHPYVALMLNNIGLAIYSLGKPQEAFNFHIKALEIQNTLYGDKPHPDVAQSLNNIGIALDKLGKVDKALASYDKALEIQKTLYGDKHPLLAITLNNIGSLLTQKPNKALGYYKQALEVQKNLYGDMHPEVGQTLSKIGCTLDELGQPNEALDYHIKALEIQKALTGDKPHLNVAKSLNNIGSAFNNNNKPNEALPYLTEALEIQKALTGEQHPDTARILNTLGLTYMNLNALDEALDYYGRALAVQKTFYGKKHPDIATSLNNIGCALYNSGKLNEALDYYKQTLELRKTLYGDKHPQVAITLINIGSTLARLGRRYQALAECNKAVNIFLLSYEEDHPHVKDAKKWVEIIKEKISKSVDP